MNANRQAAERVLEAVGATGFRVWAHYKGFADGETFEGRSNDLVILRLGNEFEAQRSLRNIFRGKSFWNEIRPKLHDLPLRIRNVDLYFAREQLWQAELRNWLEFRIEAPTQDAT